MEHGYTALYEDVRLRPLEESDIEALRIWRNDAKSNRFLRDVGYITQEMQRQWFEQYKNNENELIFAIDDMDLNCMVGSISLYDICRERHLASIGRIQIGDCRAHGKGLGRKSLVMALKCGFHFLGLEKVAGSVHPENVQAYTNDMKVGFRIVGQCASVAGGMEDRIEITEKETEKVNKYYFRIMLSDRSRGAEELYMGREGRFSKTISEHDIYGFAGITGDFNPVHIDAEEAKNSIFGKQAAHGMLVSSFFSTVIGTIMPGRGSIYLSQESCFIKPVFMGDTITACVYIRSLEAENRAVLCTKAYNQQGECVVRGRAKVILPTG